MINNPANIEHRIKILTFSRLIKISNVIASENNNEREIGLLKNFKFITLDHFESIEKNKNIAANITIGIKIAL